MGLKRDWSPKQISARNISLGEFNAAIILFRAFKYQVGLPYEIPEREELSSFHRGETEFVFHFFETHIFLQIVYF